MIIYFTVVSCFLYALVWYVKTSIFVKSDLLVELVWICCF